MNSYVLLLLTIIIFQFEKLIIKLNLINFLLIKSISI